jgi:hypothetical protein
MDCLDVAEGVLDVNFFSSLVLTTCVISYESLVLRVLLCS